MQGFSYVDEQIWRYENYGTATLLIIAGTTLTDLSETQSKTGTAFYQTTRAKSFDLPATDEIWLKFDVYFDGSNRWRAYNGGTNGTTGITAQTTPALSYFSNDKNVSQNGTSITNTIVANQLQTVLLHMVSGSTAGIVEAWVDSEFIYRYEGNVNNGEDFADIYLQSDGSGTFFSNVIISNTEIGLSENIVAYDLRIKLEVYISWIPMGQVVLKPFLLASYILAPHVEKISADLNRGISKPEGICADLMREVGQGEKIAYDTFRWLIKSEEQIADTERKISVEEKISGDTKRRVIETDTIHTDTNRRINKTEKIIGDTSRKIGITVSRAVLERRVISHEKGISDTCIRVGVEEKVSGDLYSRLARNQIATANLFRLVFKTDDARADTFRKLGSGEKSYSDTNRAITYSESTSVDTFRQIVTSDKITADLRRNLREYVRADCCRKVVRAEKTVASTVIRVPYILNYVIRDRMRTLKKNFLSAGNNSLVNTFKDCGVTAANITLNERSLSDDFTFDIARPMEINEAVQGTLLDYSFNFLVEETSQTDLVQSVKGRYNVDDFLYTQIFIPSTKIETENYTTEVVGSRWAKHSSGNDIYCYPRATEIMNVVARALGLSLDIKIDDFTPYNLSADHRVTYADIISTIFSWTSQLPQRQINVFIRGGILYCIQRDKETSVFDITNLTYSRPTVKKKLIRSLWSNPRDNSSSSDSGSSNSSSSGSGSSGSSSSGSGSSGSGSSDSESIDPIIDYLYDEYQEPFSGTISFSGNDFYTELKYSIGLLMTEKQTHSNSRESFSSTTYYIYEEKFSSNISEISINLQKAWNKNFYGDFYLIQKNTYSTVRKIEDKNIVETKQSGNTSYNYARTKGDEVYLVSEIEETATYSYRDGDLEDSDSNYRETYHVPLGNGFYGQSTYLNGACQGSNISQGKPGNKVSQYTTGEVQKTFKGWTVTYEKPSSGEGIVDGGVSIIGGNGDGGVSIIGGIVGGGVSIIGGIVGGGVSIIGGIVGGGVSIIGGNGDGGGISIIGGNGDISIDGGNNELKARYDDWRKELAPIANTSFPVRELDLLRTLTEDLLWLNRKIEETITVDLIAMINNGVPDITHIVDFTERVKFNGAEYFLVSNNITFTPRKLIQRLTLIRWY